MMKKIFISLVALMLTLSMVACSNNSEKKEESNISNKEINEVEEENKPTQKELNDALKKEAEKADFVQLNGHESENKGKKVFLEGEVTIVTKPGAVGGEFTVSVKEGDGYGIYGITSFDTENNYDIGKDIKEGDKVKIYGVVDGKDQVGAPRIVATIIESDV